MKNSLIRSVLPYLAIGIAVVAAFEFFKKPPQVVTAVPDSAALAEAGARVAAVDGIESLFAACPADIWRKRHTNSLWSRMTTGHWSEGSCQNTFTDCVTACVDRGNGKACRQMARVIEVYGLPEGNIDRRRANALACSLGNAPGCTNRGAEIRNAAIPEDAVSQEHGTARALCLFQTFDVACTAKDAWGCAMLGQSYRLGEGVVADRNNAMANYERACALHLGPEEERSEYAPCRFARTGLAAMRQD